MLGRSNVRKRSSDKMEVMVMMDVLSRGELENVAPSIFADGQLNRLSDKYQKYSTVQVAELLGKERWLPVYARQQRVRDESRAGYQKHIIRFRHEADINALRSGRKEEGFDIVMSNSHDGSSCYVLEAGIFRCVCINGLVVGASAFSFKVRHMGSTPEEVVKASLEIASKVPEVASRVDVMKGVMLSDREIQDFVISAYHLKWERDKVDAEKALEPDEAPLSFDPMVLAYPRRSEDKGNSLWSVFNRVQENMMKGSPVRVATNHGNHRIRSVKGLNEDLRINRELWNLAESRLK